MFGGIQKRSQSRTALGPIFDGPQYLEPMTPSATSKSGRSKSMTQPGSLLGARSNPTSPRL